MSSNILIWGFFFSKENRKIVFEAGLSVLQMNIRNASQGYSAIYIF